MSSTIPVRVYGKHRLRVPATLVDWTEETVVVMTPLHWKRGVELPLERQPEAWFLVAKGSEGDDWLISPEDVRRARGLDSATEELAEMILEVAVDGRNPGGWELIMPKLERDLGWLPTAGQVVAMRPENGGVAVWSLVAFAVYRAGLAMKWRNPA